MEEVNLSSLPLPATLSPLILDLGPISCRHILRSHALSKSKARAVVQELSSTTLSPDTSPIRWRVKLSLPHRKGALTNIDALCYNGAHREFISEIEATRLGVGLIPLEVPTSARLVDGSLMAITHRTSPITVEIDRQYKGDITFKVLPLKGLGIILGMPWLLRNEVNINHGSKIASFAHRGRNIVLHPSNPVFPAPPPGTIEPPTAPAWITTPPPPSLSPSRATPPDLRASCQTPSVRRICPAPTRPRPTSSTYGRRSRR